MKIKRLYKVFLGFIATGALALVVMSGCSNGKNGSTGKTGTQGQTGPLSPAPVITGLDPTMSSFNTVITITGENFATNPSVYCDGSPAMLMSSSATQITVTGCGMTNVSTLYQAMVSVFANNQMSNGLNEWIVPSGYITQFPAASLTGPQGVVSGNGKLYVADNAGVFAVDNATGWTTKIVPACPTCVLSTPAGITMDNGGNLIVTDSGSNTLVGINPTTGATWYVLGPGNGLLSTPIGVTYSNGDLYVANSGSSNVTQVNDTTLSALNLSLNIALSSAPYGITADNSGNLYVACQGAGVVDQIAVSSSNGTVINGYVTGITGSYGIGISGTSMLVTSNSNQTLYSAPVAGGAASTMCADFSPWETNSNSSIIPDGAGGLFVGDPSDGLVYHVNSACNTSTYAEGFDTSYDIAYLNGDFYVVNALFYNNTYGDAVLEVRNDGAMRVFAQVPGGPQAITVNPSGGLTIVTWNNNSVYTVSSVGVVSILIDSSKGLNGPTGLAYDNSGNLYIANNNTGNISSWNGSLINNTFATGMNSPFKMIIYNGVLYMTDAWGASKVYSVDVSTGGAVNLYLPTSVGLNIPESIGVDAFGNLLVEDYNDGALFRVDAQKHVTALEPASTTPMTNPNGIAIPQSQLIYTVEEGSTTSRMWVIAP